ncbi:MAG: hypothetical protein M3362_23265 [Acidobacteriota bacterium]|nr:hypothetical protein [Acidobacteriota bacterium]
MDGFKDTGEMNEKERTRGEVGAKKEKETLQDRVRSWVALVITVIMTVLGLAYLTAIALGWLGGNRFGVTEAIIFAAILFFNSVLIGRLETLSISGKGIDFKVREVEKEQNRQKDEIRSIQFLLKYFVTQSELNRLQELAEGSSPYQFDSDYAKNNLHNELRRLRSLDLIRMLSGKTIGGVHDGINEKKGNLNDYVRITDRGREYLELRKAIESQSYTEKNV